MRLICELYLSKVAKRWYERTREILDKINASTEA